MRQLLPVEIEAHPGRVLVLRERSDMVAYDYEQAWHHALCCFRESTAGRAWWATVIIEAQGG